MNKENNGGKNTKWTQVNVPSLLRDLPERVFSVSVFELNESDGLFCAFDKCNSFGDAKQLPSRLLSLSILEFWFFGKCWLDNCLFDGEDDKFGLFIHAAAKPLDDDVPIPNLQNISIKKMTSN